MTVFQASKLVWGQEEKEGEAGGGRTGNAVLAPQAKLAQGREPRPTAKVGSAVIGGERAAGMELGREMVRVGAGSGKRRGIDDGLSPVRG